MAAYILAESRALEQRGRNGLRGQFGTVLSALAVLLLVAGPPTALAAESPDQARRVRHFEFLKSHGVFERMGVVNGVPTLALGPGRTKTDLRSMTAFARVIFDYFVAADPTVTRMRVIDAATGQELAIVDASGYRGTL